ncbi:hypothetical protein PYCC9005_001707 [Savitreella phatthalungensis]
MLDHILGRPSTSWRKTQVIATALFWIVYARKTDPDGPPLIRKYSKRLAKWLTPWQLIIIVLNLTYIVRHFDAVIGLAAPEPLAHMYSANFYRATWFATALDAGYWTAMSVRPVWLREVLSLLFTGYYLVFANQADEKVRKIRATVTAEQLRNSWEKTTTPTLRFITGLLRPKLNILQKLKIDRGDGLEPVDAWLYFDGTREELARQEKIVIAFPGGGFVSMSPRNHDDSYCAWAKKLGAPLVAIDYKKAPERHYPYALYECYDAYREIMLTKGACLQVGMSRVRKCALVGDSAGGNYVSAVTIMLLENQSSTQVPMPSGLVLIYPFLDFNISSWMTADHLRLLRQESTADMLDSKKHHERRRSVLQVYPDERGRERGPRAMKLTDLKKAVNGLSMTRSRPTTPHDSRPGSPAPDTPNMRTTTSAGSGATTPVARKKPEMPRRQSSIGARAADRPLGTRLAMTSRVSFFADRIITPDMMRAMALLYVGPHGKPDFHTDYLLSPILAPQDILAKFPKTFFLCGEVDPFVDDTVILAGRIKEAKHAAALRRRELNMERPKSAGQESDDDYVEMTLIRGTSHGFLQMRAFLPEARNSIARCRTWLNRILEDAPARGSPVQQKVHQPSPVKGANGRVDSPVPRRGSDVDARIGRPPRAATPARKGFSIADSDEDDDEDEVVGGNFADDEAGDLNSSGQLESVDLNLSGVKAASHALTASLADVSPKEPSNDTFVTVSTAPVVDDKDKHKPWESKHLLDASELMNNRKQALVRPLQTGAK